MNKERFMEMADDFEMEFSIDNILSLSKSSKPHQLECLKFIERVKTRFVLERIADALEIICKEKKK